MITQRPATQTILTSEVSEQWNEIVESVTHDGARVLVEQRGTPVVAIVSAEDFERLQQFDADREAFFTALETISEPFADVPPAEIEEEVARALAAVRGQRRGVTDSDTAKQ